MKIKNDDILRNFLLFPAYFLLFASLNKVYGDAPFSYGLYGALLFTGEPLLLTSLAFILGLLVYRDYTAMILGCIYCLVFLIVFLFCRKKGKRIAWEVIICILLGIAPYLAIDFPAKTVEKLVYVSIIAIIFLLSITAYHFICDKKLSKNSRANEVFSAIAIFVFSSVGFINLFGINVYKPLAVFTFVLLSRYYKNNISLLVATTVAIPFVITTGSFEYFAVFTLYYAVYILLKNTPSAIIFAGLSLTELCCGFFFKFYGSYEYADGIFTLLLILLTTLISPKQMDKLSEKFNFDYEKSLVRSTINKNRAEASGRLYDVSNVFFQMETAFKNLKKCTESTDVLVEKMTDEVLFNICSGCRLSGKCQQNNAPNRSVIEKIIRIGIAKGRITIVDLPRNFTDTCGFPNSAIFEVNRLIGQYYEYVKTAEGGDKIKEILSLHASGVGGVLKGLAFSLSKSATENLIEEKRILKALSAKGIRCEGALCLGEGKDTEIQLIISTRYYTERNVAEILSEAFSTKLTTVRAEAVGHKTVALTMKLAPKLDAVFGVSKITKQNSTASGDCHSLVKIDEGNFLVALSDGMGSGEIAEKTSETALNLIESLYKSGLETEFILSLVNKLLAVSIDDNFSAVDVALVNLRDGDTAFIKIGAPYGFVVSDTGIRFIEGSSLPLGILDDLHPTTAKAPLVSGDVIVMVSDGVTDAFNSSGELVDFLKSAPIKNPQELADLLVQKALFLSNGIPEDDMTAVCVRLIDVA